MYHRSNFVAIYFPFIFHSISENCEAKFCSFFRLHTKGRLAVTMLDSDEKRVSIERVAFTVHNIATANSVE